MRTTYPARGKSVNTQYDYDLGTCSFRVSTCSAEAQRWFDRGLVWCYAFAHEEAVRCFRRAAGHDPECAMAWWGIGYASGPYYNKPWEKFDPVDLATTLSAVRSAAREALDRIASTEPVERALIEALARRYPSSEPTGDFDRWNDDYADAMRDVYRSFPNDPDVCTLFAEALMNRTPWALWDLETGEPATGADTLEAIEALEGSITAREAAGEADHPGLLHMYIHVLEMSPHPERALRAADRLRDLVPDAGHLRHMPTHIDVQCGDYRATVEWNVRAVAADRKYADREAPGVWFTLSFAHNYHFMLYGAMLLGDCRAATAATRGLLEVIPESVLRTESPPMADWLEGYVAMQVHAPIRFGRWREILAMPPPRDPVLYCTTTAMLHYAKGLAHAVLEDVPAARAERARFEAAVARVPGSRIVFNNTCLDILAIAAEMLHGEVSYRAGDHDIAFEHLRTAVRLADTLPYDEPWGWMQPPRHALGALLLEQDRVEEAEAVYRADLGLDPALAGACRHPENVWSLHGFHECLVRRGKHAEAALVAPRLALALARTDVPIESSCLCRRRCMPCSPERDPRR